MLEKRELMAVNIFQTPGGVLNIQGDDGANFIGIFSFGFGTSDETGTSYDEMKDRIMGELKKVFRPEFLNRIDEVIVFHKLTKEEITEIVELLLKRIRESLAERELSLNLSSDAADFLVEKGWDPAMGARPLRRAIQRYIEDPLADEVLAQSMPPGSTIEVGKAAEEDEKDMTITIVKPAKVREAVGVGAKGGELEEGPAPEDSGDTPELPDEPEVLPDVPDAPPPDEE
jgi:ATP-dependent Clp protease ATP-binding subunit ClpC